eukprot:1837661-Rhodomonas_salina.2
MMWMRSARANVATWMFARLYYQTVTHLLRDENYLNNNTLTSGCRSSPNGCGRAPSRHRRRRRWPCSRCQQTRCTAGEPGRSGRRPWRRGQQRSG